MAGYNRNRYQYETSPRKLEPEYRPIKKKYPKKSTAKKSSTKVKSSLKSKREAIQLEAKTKAIICVVILFAILFAISYRNAIISEKYSQIKDMKASLAAIEKDNEQLEVNIESKTNLSAVEKLAKEKLGMKKLSDGQIIYINLAKQDYVESAADDIIIEENQNVFQKIIENIQNCFKSNK